MAEPKQETQNKAAALPGANPTDSAMARAQAQAMAAIQPTTREEIQTAQTAEKLGAKAMTTDSPEKTPQWKDTTPQTPTERVDQAGLKMQSAGVTYSPKGPSEVAGHGVNNGPQSEAVRTDIQAKLDAASQKGQNATGKPLRGGQAGSCKPNGGAGIAGGAIHGQIGGAS